MHVESALLIVLQQEIGIGRLSQRRLLYLCSCVTFWAQVVHPYSLLPLQQKRAQNSEPNRKYIKHHVMLGKKGVKLSSICLQQFVDTIQQIE